MSDFNLKALIRDVCATSDIADPSQLCILVRSRIADEDLEFALNQALRGAVRDVIRWSRGNTHKPAVDQPPSVRELNPSVGPKRSAYVTALRYAWQQRLRDRVHVGDSQWKFLGDCTFDDLMSAANERQKIAVANAACANQYKTWADLLQHHGVRTFNDLPADTQKKALAVAA